MILTFEISNLVKSIKFNKVPRNILVDIIKSNITYGGTQYRNLICGSTNKLFLFKGCHISCDIRSACNAATCVNASETRYSRTFWMYLAIRFSVSLGIAILNGLFDVASTVIVKELDADVGYQHMWHAVAVCLFAPISGGLVDLLSAGKDIKDYRPCFYLYATLYTAGAFVSLFVDFSPKLSSKNSFKNLKILLSKPEINVMLFHVLILGISWGFLENFLFWFLESEVSSPTFLLGVSLTINAGTSIPMTIFSTWITKNIGYFNATIVAFVAYVIRFIGYSYVYNPYICLFYGTLENFTLTLSAVGIMLYCYHLVPLKTIDTMKMLWISTHFIMGRSLGSFSGGYFINFWGFRKTFRVYSYICAGMSGFCYLVNLFYLRNKNNDSQNEQEKWKRVLKITGVLSHLGFLEVPIFGSLVLTNVSTNSVSFILSVNKRCHTYILPHKSLQMKDRQSHNLSSTCSYTSPYSEKHHHINVVSPRSLQVKDRRSHSLPCSILYLKKTSLCPNFFIWKSTGEGQAES
ncbi:major facilitator superfamily domain-containing protein 6-like [Tachypleus tridentatus]|uniref:major facilitator superfamily domain-containing protein 6-like n=1 Tax=Tachypleus tridentatus TaxID=6853 RepID=UPI003FCF3E43